jgi:hypothetical protein
MELLDRYLKAVGSCLPEAQRDDIISELSDNIRSQIEDKETELRRPLIEAEVEAILKHHGHPLIVAGRFRQDQRSVSFGREIIGPTLFPFYLRVLKYNLGLTSLILVVLFTALFLGGQVVAASIFPTFLYQFLIQFGVVTLLFSVADRHWKQHPDRWDPQNLKHAWHPVFAIQLEPKRKAAVKTDAPRVSLSRFDSVAQIVALTVGLAWLRVAQHAPFVIFGPAALFLKLGPIWQEFYSPVVALFLAGILQAAINLVRPDWVRLHLLYRILSDAAWMVIFFFLFKAGNWIVLADAAGISAGYRNTVDILNRVAFYLLAGLCLHAAYNVFRNGRRLVRARHLANTP